MNRHDSGDLHSRLLHRLPEINEQTVASLLPLFVVGLLAISLVFSIAGDQHREVAAVGKPLTDTPGLPAWISASIRQLLEAILALTAATLILLLLTRSSAALQHGRIGSAIRKILVTRQIACSLVLVVLLTLLFIVIVSLIRGAFLPPEELARYVAEGLGAILLVSAFWAMRRLVSKRVHPSADDAPEITININTASMAMMCDHLGIRVSQAKEIVKYRERQRFEAISDLTKVPGIGDKTFEAIKDKIQL
jgi:competence ComEA-like helix-hairpin-helix protein